MRPVQRIPGGLKTYLQAFINLFHFNIWSAKFEFFLPVFWQETLKIKMICTEEFTMTRTEQTPQKYVWLNYPHNYMTKSDFLGVKASGSWHCWDLLVWLPWMRREGRGWPHFVQRFDLWPNTCATNDIQVKWRLKWISHLVTWYLVIFWF